MSLMQHPIRFPQGVADENGRVGFVERHAGNIAAIDLETGKVLWATMEPAHPLLVCRERLLAYRLLAPNTLQIVGAVVRGDGTLTTVSEPVVFLDWVSIDPEDSREFSITATADNHFLLLAWEAHSFYLGGAPPSDQVIKQARKDASGVVRIDLDTYKVALLPGESRSKASSSTTPLPKDAISGYCQIDRYFYGQTEERLDDSRRRSILKKWEADSGKLVWELNFDEWRSTRAPPRRL